jgi:peptide/nickel transport system permease protein
VNAQDQVERRAASRTLRLPFDIGEARITLRILRSSPLSMIGAVIAIAFAACAILTWVTNNAILPYDPYAISTGTILLPPSPAHLLGTDDLGRDVLSRVFASTPIDAEVSFSVVGLAVVLGLITGGVAGYVGGWVEEIVMRVTDIFLAFPGIVLALAISAALGPSIPHSILAIAPVWWPAYTRLARGETLSTKSLQFVDASRAVGQTNLYIIVRHIIPNIIPVLLVYATLDIGNVILVFSVLSFIGLGAQAPTPEWGLMTVQLEQYLRSAPWCPLAPGVAILIVAVAFSLLGDGLRDALDPSRRGLFG